MKKTIVKILICVSMLQSCGDGAQPVDKEFVGVWEAKDGASITLYTDGTCVFKNINWTNIRCDIFDRFKGPYLSEGTWLFESPDEYYKDYRIGIIGNRVSEDDVNVIATVGFSLKIRGQGILRNRKPWVIYCFIGDPDLFDKYEFYKKE